MKRYIYVLLAVFIAAALIMSGCQAKPAEVITLKLSTYLTETHFAGQMNKWWASELERRTDGQVKVDCYFSGALVKTQDCLPAVSKGIADVQLVGHGMFPTQLPLFGGLDLVYQTTSFWVQEKCLIELTDTYAPLQKELEENNIIPMFGQSTGEVVIGANKPLKTLDDLQGQKIRGYGLLNQAMEILGASPVAIPITEVYEALERGTIDACTGVSYVAARSFKFHEVAKTIIDPGIGCYAAANYYMNLDTWNKLPKDVKEIIKQLNKDYLVERTKLQNQQLKETTETLIANENDIYCLPADEVERWKAKLVPKIYDDWVSEMEAKGLPGRELLDLYHELIEKYEKIDEYENPYPCPS